MGGPYLSLEQVSAAGAVTINYGRFANTIVRFLILAFVVYVVVKNVNRMRKKEVEETAPVTKECPYCTADLE